jgi:nitrate reductase alpha subunit
VARRGARREAERTAGLAAGHLLRAGAILRRTPATPDPRAVLRTDPGVNDASYRGRWAQDRETQETDHPSTGPDRPEDAPCGRPRGASFSWYTYSPTRVRHPHVRGVPVEMYREARARLGDPVAAWAEVTGDAGRRRRHRSARGEGGPVHIGRDEALEIAAGMYRTDATDAFHSPLMRAASGSRGSLRGRADLLDRNGLGRPDGRFPGREAEGPR